MKYSALLLLAVGVSVGSLQSCFVAGASVSHVANKSLEDSATVAALTKRHDEADNGGRNNCHIEYKNIVVPDSELHLDGQGNLVKRENHFVKNVKVCTSNAQGKPLTTDECKAVADSIDMAKSFLSSLI